jgi:hypothetical protein
VHKFALHVDDPDACFKGLRNKVLKYEKLCEPVDDASWEALK